MTKSSQQLADSSINGLQQPVRPFKRRGLAPEHFGLPGQIRGPDSGKTGHFSLELVGNP